MTKKKLTAKSENLPTTRKMLSLVRNELKSDIRSLEKKMDARFNQVDARFNEVDARFDKMDARFNSLESKFENLAAKVERMGFLVEEQNANNRLVLEALIGINSRLDRHELRMDRIEETVRDLARRRPSQQS